MKHWTSWRRARRWALCVGAVIALFAACDQASGQTLHWIEERPGSPYISWVAHDDEPIVIYTDPIATYYSPSCRINRITHPDFGLSVNAISDKGDLLAITWRQTDISNVWIYQKEDCDYTPWRTDLYYPKSACNNYSSPARYLGAVALSRQGRWILTRLSDQPYGWCTDRAFPIQPADDFDYHNIPFLGNAIDDEGNVAGEWYDGPYNGPLARLYWRGNVIQLQTDQGINSQAWDFAEVYGSPAIVGAWLSVANNDIKIGWWRDDGNGNFTFEAVGGGIPVDGYPIYGMAASRDATVIVGWKKCCNFGFYPFLWRASDGQVVKIPEEFSYLLAPGEDIATAHDVSHDGRYIVGVGIRPTGPWGEPRYWKYLLDLYGCNEHNGDIDNNRCVDDADLLAVLFAFGQSGENLGRVDVNCDRVVDDADLLIVLFNFGSGC